MLTILSKTVATWHGFRINTYRAGKHLIVTELEWPTEYKPRNQWLPLSHTHFILSWIFSVVYMLIQARPCPQCFLSFQPYYTNWLEASFERTFNNTFKKCLPFPQPQSSIYRKKFFDTATLTFSLRNRHFMFHISCTIFGIAPAPFGICTSSGSLLIVEIFTIAYFP